MYLYTVVILALSGLTLVNSRNLQSTNLVSYKRVLRILPHVNSSVLQGKGELSQKPDRCGPVAFKCYEPILSYMDTDGEFCGWKDMNTFRTLPQVCKTIGGFCLGIWGKNVVKNKYRFIKTCDKIKTFQKCVRNNQVCKRDYEVIKIVMSLQNRFCDNLQVILPVVICANAWDSSVNWDKLVYTDWRIVQVCPATTYRQLALNSIKLFLFTYITFPSAWTDGVVDSVNAEAAGRLICKSIQQHLCLWKRGDAVCQGYLPMRAYQQYYDQNLINKCSLITYNEGKCIAFVNMMCPINLASGHITVKIDFSDIRNVYNMTYWHTVGQVEADILLNTVNKAIGHCDPGNLIFKQLGCFHQYLTQLDMNYANHGNYLSEYMCNNIKLYNSCFEAYINASCPDEASQFQGIGSFLHAQCDILRVANRNVTCPLYAVYSHVMFTEETWFTQIMYIMEQYITIIKFKQMNPAPSGWRDMMTYNADMLISYYKSELIKGAKISSASSYNNVLISTVCDQEVADVYNDFVTLSTGEQFYQLLSHGIKGFEYIKYLAK